MMDVAIRDIWRRMSKPPWVTLHWNAGSHCYDHIVFYQIENQKRRRRQVVKFEACHMYKADDSHTIRYIASVLQDGLEDVMRNTVDAAVGSIDVYRDDD